MTREQVLKHIPPGWGSVVDTLFEILDRYDFLKINSISRDYGLFRITFEDVENKSDKFIADSIKFKIERDCVHICESCGNHGKRRKIFDPPRVYCTKCVVLEYNEYITENN